MSLSPANRQIIRGSETTGNADNFDFTEGISFSQEFKVNLTPVTTRRPKIASCGSRFGGSGVERANDLTLNEKRILFYSINIEHTIRMQLFL